LNDYSFFSAPQLKRDPLGSAISVPLIAVLAVLLITLGVVMSWRASRSLDRLVHKHFAVRARHSLPRAVVEEHLDLAPSFLAQATEHLINLDRDIVRLTNRAKRPDRDAEAALIALQEVRTRLVADIEWSRQVTLSRGAA